jgi:hypothetical protein
MSRRFPPAVNCAVSAESIIHRDFLDSFQPTTTVGLFGDSTADRMISKHSFCSTTRSSGRLLAMMSPQAACVEAFIADPRRPI